MVDRIVAACDGAAKGNPGPAAWAWVVADAQAVPQRWEAGPLGHATNNVAELTALLQMLAATDPEAPLEVRMDSQYAMNAVTKWLPNWKRNGWRTSGGKPVANKELVVRIDELLTGRAVTFVYVPAHQVDGDPLNDIADQAASRAAITQQPASGTGADAPSSTAGGSATQGQRRDRPRGGSSPQRPQSGPTGSTGAGPRTAKGPAGSLKARFPGTCSCARPYAVGDLIAKGPRGWGHPECADGSAG